jgi:mRNA-degrading endonuclease toxin of MazEF toxin-antitoxin module
MWVKRDLHDFEHTPPLFKEGEVWWCRVGENIGVEINGKGDEFTRPTLIFRKYDRYSFLGLPLSTKIKIGSWYEQVNFKGCIQTVTLVQGKTLDYKRLKEKMGQLKNDEFKHVIDSYIGLHNAFIKIDPPL